MGQSITNKQLIKYCATLFLVSWLLQIGTLFITRDFNNNLARVGLALTMVSPLFVTLGFSFVNKSIRSRVLWKPNKNIFSTSILAVLIPTLSAFAVLFIASNLSYGTSGWFEFSLHGVMISGGPFLLGLGQQSWLFFVSNILVTGAFYSTLTGLLAIGEEYAWRGFLQGELIGRLGEIKGIVLLGFLWAMWHLPIQLAGYNYPENQIIGSFIISPLMLISGSFFFGWLTLKSNSFLPAALAHGAFNTIEEGIISNIALEVPTIYLILVKLVVTILTGLFFMFLFDQTGKPSIQSVMKTEE